MLALPLKYPPLDRQRLEVLQPKLAACRCLLRALPRSAAGKPRAEAQP
jgi:hypothetical protein